MGSILGRTEYGSANYLSAAYNMSYFVEFPTDVLFSFDFRLRLLRSQNELLFEFLLEVVLGSFSDMESAIQPGNDIGLFFREVHFLFDRNSTYHCLTIKFPPVDGTTSFHGEIDILKNNKSLPSHPNVLLGNDIEDLSVLLQHSKQLVFEIVKRYFLIQITDIQCVVRCKLVTVYFVVLFYDILYSYNCLIKAIRTFII